MHKVVALVLQTPSHGIEETGAIFPSVWRRTRKAIAEVTLRLPKTLQIFQYLPLGWTRMSRTVEVEGCSRRSMLVALATAPLALVGVQRAAAQGQSAASLRSEPLQISGIYPHLAVFNDVGGDQDRECGIGAVVAWADRLWLMTYPPHRRTGSPDKLYEIDERLQMTIRPESVGGTHAGRMIHRESLELVMGPYFIDA